jgi:CheY-like chemotaxis protein
VQLASSVETDTADWWMGDPGRVRQVLLNLIGNSLKFTEAGSVTARASAVGAGLQFEVIDTGIGIPVEKQKQIFEAFSQVDGSITRRFGGTGLGLTICSRLVERMAGTISVRSAPGEGSTFSFTVTAAHAEGVAPARTPGRTPETRPLIILVAEDNVVNQTVVVRMLERAGHSVRIASNGKEAVEMCSLARFDLILMDVHMPVLDGFRATAQIREAGQTTPIIALTASAMAGDRERCVAAGMDGYISKPVSRDELLETISRFAGNLATV